MEESGSHTSAGKQNGISTIKLATKTFSKKFFSESVDLLLSTIIIQRLPDCEDYCTERKSTELGIKYFHIVGKPFCEKLEAVKSALFAELGYTSHSTKSSSSGTSSSYKRVSLTLDLIEEVKKTGYWQFLPNSQLVRERWIVDMIFSPDSATPEEGQTDQARNDLRSLLTESARECLMHSDQFAEGYPNSVSLSYKIAKG